MYSALALLICTQLLLLFAVNVLINIRFDKIITNGELSKASVSVYSVALMYLYLITLLAARLMIKCLQGLRIKTQKAASVFRLLIAHVRYKPLGH